MSDNTDNTTESDTSSLGSSITSDQLTVLSLINISVLPISLFACTIGILTFLYIRLKYPRLADRVTFRLAFAAIVSETFYAIFQMIMLFQLNPSPICGFIVCRWVFSSLISIFFPICIAMVSIYFIH